MNNIQNQDSADFTGSIKELTETFAANAELQENKKKNCLRFFLLSSQATPTRTAATKNAH